MNKKQKLKQAKSFDELLDIEHGKIGSKKRDRFEENTKQFLLELQGSVNEVKDVLQGKKQSKPLSEFLKEL